MQNEIKFTKGQIGIIVCVVVVPLLIGIFACYMIFGDLSEAVSKMWEYRGKPNSTASSVTSLSYIFTILIAFYAFCVTTYFSGLLWKVSNESLLVSQKLQNLEDNRDKEIVRENALIVYYDLQRGISNLRNIYINCVLNGTEAKLNRIYFSTEWIKNVANLRDGLTNQELNRVYKLYEQFYALQNILEEYKVNEPNDELIEFIEELSKEVFADFIPFSLMDKLKVSSIDELVDIDLYIILQKIYSLTFISSEDPKENVVNGKTVYKTYINGVLFFVGDSKKAFVGNGELYNTNGNIKCSGHFNSKQFIKDTIYGYYESTKKCYEITYEAQLIKKGTLYKLTNDGGKEYFHNGEFKDGEISNGTTTLFYENHKISYQGEIKDGLRSGQGRAYDRKDQLIFDGIWKEDLYFKGILFKEGKETFNGEFKDSIPWTGDVKNYDLSQHYVKDFTGEICKGIPIKGEGFIFHMDSQARGLADLNEYDKWIEDKIEEQIEAEQDPDYMANLAEEQAEFENERIRQSSNHWSNYIKAQWTEGIATEAENKEMNKKVII
ncbi:hypothetical protein P4257_22555 [Bacillus thuringiensis]|nr:hypothetical protein [Bacillus thuringiensis]MED2812222.1 hypothetical protein [Bacillus thuringiensis]MED2829116.1 hypothetical protein [Bacillus thuringiensis]MED2831315.1 hypothetical protein [Bacillus thuringiensis]MED2858345.1 hypothetical protein [Bacillus thuringiensis]